MAFLEKRETIQLRLKNVFDRLESNDLNQCFGALMDLTSTISSECNLVPLFLQAGGIQNIIFQLNKGDRNLTAICLDILIHSPIPPEQSRHFQELAGLKVLGRILQHFGNEPFILNKTCQVITSLVHDKQAVTELVMRELPILLSMGRIFETFPDEEMLICRAIQVVQTLSISMCSFYVLGEEKIYHRLSNLLVATNNANIQNQLLDMFFHLFTDKKLFPPECCAQYLTSKLGGNFIARFIELGQSHSSPVAIRASNLLFHLMNNEKIRPLMAQQNIFEALIHVIKVEMMSGNLGDTIWLNGFLQLSHDNPDEFRKAGGIAVLLQVNDQFDVVDRLANQLLHPKMRKDAIASLLSLVSLCGFETVIPRAKTELLSQVKQLSFEAVSNWKKLLRNQIRYYCFSSLV